MLLPLSAYCPFLYKYLSSLTFSGTGTVYLKAPEMLQNPADNYTVNPNGKLITPSASGKCTVHCSAGPLQDATLLDREEISHTSNSK